MNHDTLVAPGAPGALTFQTEPPLNRGGSFIYELMNNTQKKRMDTLIDYFDQLNEKEPERFSLEKWMASPGSYLDLDDAVSTWQEHHRNGEPLGCNTSACVVGHLPVVFPDHFYWKKSPKAPDHAAVRTLFASHLPISGVDELLLRDYFGGSGNWWGYVIYAEHYGEGNRPDLVKLSSVIERLKLLREHPDATLEEIQALTHQD